MNISYNVHNYLCVSRMNIHSMSSDLYNIFRMNIHQNYVFEFKLIEYLFKTCVKPVYCRLINYAKFRFFILSGEYQISNPNTFEFQLKFVLRLRWCISPAICVCAYPICLTRGRNNWLDGEWGGIIFKKKSCTNGQSRSLKTGRLIPAIKSKVQVFDTLQVVNCFKVESDAALLPSWFNW